MLHRKYHTVNTNLENMENPFHLVNRRTVMHYFLSQISDISHEFKIMFIRNFHKMKKLKFNGEKTILRVFLELESLIHINMLLFLYHVDKQNISSMSTFKEILN